MVLCWGEAARGEKNLQLGYGVSGWGVARGGNKRTKQGLYFGFCSNGIHRDQKDDQRALEY